MLDKEIEEYYTNINEHISDDDINKLRDELTVAMIDVRNSDPKKMKENPCRYRNLLREVRNIIHNQGV